MTRNNNNNSVQFSSIYCVFINVHDDDDDDDDNNNNNNDIFNNFLQEKDWRDGGASYQTDGASVTSHMISAN